MSIICTDWSGDRDKECVNDGEMERKREKKGRRQAIHKHALQHFFYYIFTFIAYSVSFVISVYLLSVYVRCACNLMTSILAFLSTFFTKFLFFQFSNINGTFFGDFIVFYFILFLNLHKLVGFLTAQLANVLVMHLESLCTHWCNVIRIFFLIVREISILHLECGPS